jgi:outer membrane protein assembly factor BamB
MGVLTADDVDVPTGLGWSLAIDENLILAGAPADDADFPFGGSVFVFDVLTGQIKHKLSPSQPSLQGFFGVSVAIKGSTAVIGAPVQEGTPYSPFVDVYDPGSAYVFNVMTGEELFRLTPDDSAGLDHFGTRVAVSGNLAVITAYGDSHAGNNAGSAYVFDITTGRQIRKITASDASEGDSFGGSLAVDGNLALVGAGGNKIDGEYYGAAYLFDITTGEQLHKLISPDSQRLDYFARSVAISDGLALVGAPEWDQFGNDSQGGFVDVFDIETGQWLRRLRQEDPEDFASFGYAMSLEGDLAIIGAYSKSGEGGRRGAVYFFDINTGEQLDKITGPYFGEIDSFGHAVARDGDITVVGAYKGIGSNLLAGNVHVYRDIPEPASVTVSVFGAGVLTGGGRHFRRPL